MPIKRDPSTPPPVIGKIGPYTVFMTPPPTPHDPSPAFEPPSPSPRKAVAAPPPVKPPPQQIDASAVAGSDGSVVGFLRNAVSSVQNAHSSLDDHLARWFGLNQSKYQWALDDYYESKGMWIKVLVELNNGLRFSINLNIEDLVSWWIGHRVYSAETASSMFRLAGNVDPLFMPLQELKTPKRKTYRAKCRWSEMISLQNTLYLILRTAKRATRCCFRMSVSVSGNCCCFQVSF